MEPNRISLGGALCGLLATAPLSTSHADWYVGANVGQSSIDTSAGEIEQAFLIDDDFVASGTTLDKTDTGWKGYVGYRFLPLLSLEVGYADLGKATFNTTIADAPPPFGDFTPFDIDGTATADGPQASLLLQVPLRGPVSAFARAGAFRWEAEFTEFIPDTGTTRVARTEARTDPMYGIGVQLTFAALGVRLEWERLESVGEGIGGREGRDIDYFSAGVIVEFR
jgi:OOP family OmpA-OmpF porin